MRPTDDQLNSAVPIRGGVVNTWADVLNRGWHQLSWLLGSTRQQGKLDMAHQRYGHGLKLMHRSIHGTTGNKWSMPKLPKRGVLYPLVK